MISLENLFGNSGDGYLKLGKVLIQWGSISVPLSQYVLVYPRPYKNVPVIVISTWNANSTVTHSNRNENSCRFYGTNKQISIDWATIGIV